METIISTTPLDLLSCWPIDEPLIALHSGPGSTRWSRWSIFASPRAWFRHHHGRSSIVGWMSPELTNRNFTHDPLADLDRILAATKISTAAGADAPFHGGWIGYIAYELGRMIEPRATHGACSDVTTPARWPLIELAWCPNAIIHDNVTDRWHYTRGSDLAPSNNNDGHLSFGAGPLRSTIRRDEYLEAVHRTKGYIAAGDIYQANIAQWFSASFDGSVRGLSRQALTSSGAWHGAHLELPGDRAIISMSPELFLSYDPSTRQVTTRPIKGTRPAARPAAELAASAKDAAELHMIVDLMRNDLGRVCEIGSVQVTDPRSIETHRTVHHGVAEVVGRLRSDQTIGSLLRATFPGGSVTGAPKIRAMQVIDELERRPRGPYCGAIGFISNNGAARFNIAIRTIMLQGRRTPGRWDRLEGTLEYAAGCGIVADSDPQAELDESLDKTMALREALAARRSGSSAPRSSDPAWAREPQALMP